MQHSNEFSYRGGSLCCEQIKLADVANKFGTPAYVYSGAAIRSRFREFGNALGSLAHRVCFAVKANSNLAVLSLLAAEGAGFDIVSGGELYRVVAAGGRPGSVVFSGVGKTESEIQYALEQGIHSFNCESAAELETISKLAQKMGRAASIAIRVNPDVDAVTHPYISTGLREHKFGVDIHAAEEIYLAAWRLPGVVPEGVSCHIGSQLLAVEPVLEAADKMLTLVELLRRRGLPIRFLDLGGGLGVSYRPMDRPASIGNFLGRLREKLGRSDLEIFVEPGRSIVAEAGVLLSRVILVKENGGKTFVVLDAGMNDLIRPALYQAYHEIVPLEEEAARRKQMKADVVGPVCETGDFFARERELAELRAGDLVAICTTGAYGFVLASNYNSRPRPCELLIEGDRIHVARKRETFADLVRGETTLDPTGAINGAAECEDDRFACDICSDPA
jgi:diaminopimelate decarboxylase